MADVTVFGNDFQALPRKFKDMGDGTYAEVVSGSGGSSSPYGARQLAKMTAEGYYADNFSREIATSNSLLISGTVYYQSFGLVAGDVVTNVLAMCSASGATFSGIGMKVGIYSKAGSKLAESGDVSATFSSTGAKTAALSSPYTVPTTDGYYIALIAIATTTPTLLRTSQSLVGLGPFTGGTLNALGNQTGQTDLPASATIVTTATIGFWVGVN